MDELDETPEPLDPQEEVQADAAQAEHLDAAPEPPVDAAQVLENMESMSETGAQEAGIDTETPPPDAAQSVPVQETPDPAAELPLVEPEILDDPSLAMPSAPGEAAANVPLPEPPVDAQNVLGSLEDMTDAAAQANAIPKQPPTQQEAVRQSIPKQHQEQLEFEAGRFDAGMADMDQLTAETAYRETDYAWKRLMTHMVIDHQHRLEQLLAMLERER